MTKHKLLPSVPCSNVSTASTAESTQTPRGVVPGLRVPSSSKSPRYQAPRHIKYQQSCGVSGGHGLSAVDHQHPAPVVSCVRAGAVENDPLRLLQAQFLRLQQQYDEQNRFIRELVVAHKKLQEENQQLKSVRAQFGTSHVPPRMATSMNPKVTPINTAHVMKVNTMVNVAATPINPNCAVGSKHTMSRTVQQPVYVPSAPSNVASELFNCADIVDEVIREENDKLSVAADCTMNVNAANMNTGFSTGYGMNPVTLSNGYNY